MRKQDERISARIKAEARLRIERLIEEGQFKDLSMFLRIAITDLLERVREESVKDEQPKS